MQIPSLDQIFKAIVAADAAENPRAPAHRYHHAMTCPSRGGYLTARQRHDYTVGRARLKWRAIHIVHAQAVNALDRCLLDADAMGAAKGEAVRNARRRALDALGRDPSLHGRWCETARFVEQANAVLRAVQWAPVPGDDNPAASQATAWHQLRLVGAAI